MSRKLIVAHLVILLILAAACVPTDPDPSEWCYLFDFRTADLFHSDYGVWESGQGYKSDPLHHLVLSYHTDLLVSPTHMEAGVSFDGGGLTDINVNGEFFGTTVTNVTVKGFLPGFTPIKVPIPDTTKYGKDVNVALSASDDYHVSYVKVWGELVSPFGPSNCSGGTATPPPSDVPTTPTSFPTLTKTPTIVPTVAPSATNTVAATYTPSVTPTFTPSPTYQTVYSQTYCERIDGGSLNGAWSTISGLSAAPLGTLTGSDGNPAGSIQRQSWTGAGLRIAFPADVSILYVGFDWKAPTGGSGGLQIRLWSSTGTQLDNKNPSGFTSRTGSWMNSNYWYSAIGGNVLHVRDVEAWVASSNSNNSLTAIDNICVVYISESPTATPTVTVTPSQTATPTTVPSSTTAPTGTRPPNPTWTAVPGTASPSPSPSRTPIPVYIPPTGTPRPTATRTPQSATATANVNGTVTAMVITSTAQANATGTALAGGTPTPDYFGTSNALTTGTAAAVGTQNAFTDGAAGNVGDIGHAIISTIGNAMSASLNWFTGLSNRWAGFSNAWYSTPPEAPPSLPLCQTHPLDSELCAIYYILTYTILAGPVGSLLVPLATIVVDMYSAFFFIRMARALIARMAQIIQ